MRQDYLRQLESVKQERKYYKKAKARLEASLTAQHTVQVTAQAVQISVHGRVSSVVNECLKIVFEDPPTFHILFERKRSRTQARIVFIRNGYELDPVTEDSGGMVNVAAFGLMLARLLFSRPQKRRVLFLDEPFPGLSRDHGERVREMLLRLSKELKLQIVMVTHDLNLVAGKVIPFGKDVPVPYPRS